MANSRLLSARARGRIAELYQEIERLQRSEEAIVVATGAARAWMPAMGRAGCQGSSRLLKMQLKWHWLRVGVVYEFKALPTLPFGSLLSFKRLLRSTWAT